MTPEQILAAIAGMLEVQRQLQESQIKVQAEMTRIEQNLAKTKAIANSNARAIMTNTEANLALGAKLDRLTDLVDRYTLTTEDPSRLNQCALEQY